MPRAIKPIRWTIAFAATEFAIDRQTLATRIKSKGILPGEDKKFSTADISNAIHTNAVEARTSLAKSQKENCDLRNKKLSGELADKALFQKISDGVIIILRQKISDSELSEHAKIEILKDIQKINIDELVSNNPQADDSDLEE